MDGPQFHGEIETAKTTQCKFVVVELEQAGCDPKDGYLVRLVLTTDHDGDVVEVEYTDMQPSAAGQLARLLAVASQLAGPDVSASPGGPRELPIVGLCGNEFFLDEQLRQIRSIRNPLHSFDLDDRSKA
jgi:hypothetical protein